MKENLSWTVKESYKFNLEKKLLEKLKVTEGMNLNLDIKRKL